jgi:hypothetical protein
MNTGHTPSGIQIVVTSEHVARAQRVCVDPVSVALIEQWGEAQPGVTATQIDLTFPEGAYFYVPAGNLQEAIEAFERGEAFEPGTYTATVIEREMESDR